MKDDTLTILVFVSVVGAVMLYVTLQVTGVTAAELVTTLRSAMAR